MAECEGSKDEIERFLRKVPDHWYVYELCRPDQTVFYVGKGTKRRVFEHELEAVRHHPSGESNPFKCNVIRKILHNGGAVHYRIDRVFGPDREKDCLIHEADLIQRHGRLHENGPLTNLAGGVGSVSGAAPHSVAKHAATLSGAPENNPQRAILNEFLQGVGPVGSVPVKPVGQISRILPTTPHPQKRSPTQRCAYALIASAVANEIQICPGATIPRSFTYRGVDGIIENGVARDMVKAGMVTLVASEEPENEGFRLDSNQCKLLADLVGRDHLQKRGLL